MSEFDVRLKDMAGNHLYPATHGHVVFNNEGENLGEVEAGAQVNIIENVTINGTTGTLTEKTLAFQIEGLADDYTIEKLATPSAGFSATYQLLREGVAVGDRIDIPKDLVVQSGEVKTCTQANVPVAGYQVGDVYIDILLANADNQHIYIKATDLVDVYTAGAGLTLNDHEFSINTADTAVVDTTPTTGSSKLVQSGGVADAIKAVDDKVEALDYYTQAQVDGKDKAVKDDIYGRIWSNVSNPAAGYFQTKYLHQDGSQAMLWNESDGGGSQYFNKAANVRSYVGTNDGGATQNDIDVQIYSIDDTTKVGTRLNTNPTGLYYVKGAKGQGNPVGREVAVKDDVDAVTTTLSNDYYTKSAANALFLTYDVLEDYHNG